MSPVDSNERKAGKMASKEDVLYAIAVALVLVGTVAALVLLGGAS
jgi:hypothetical protein